MISMLERAIALALDAHAGQKQKNGLPYVLHPLHLMGQVESEHAKIVAVLHDVIEDTDVTLEDLQDEGFPDEVIVAIGLLTHQKGMSYEQYVENIRPNALASTVKLADLEHNMDIRRLETFSSNTGERLERYLHAWKRLKSLEENG